MQPLTLDWFQIIALLGAVQGCFLVGVVATQRRNRTANRILAIAIFAFSKFSTELSILLTTSLSRADSGSPRKSGETLARLRDLRRRSRIL